MLGPTTRAASPCPTSRSSIFSAASVSVAETGVEYLNMDIARRIANDIRVDLETNAARHIPARIVHEGVTQTVESVMTCVARSKMNSVIIQEILCIKSIAAEE